MLQGGLSEASLIELYVCPVCASLRTNLSGRPWSVCLEGHGRLHRKITNYHKVAERLWLCTLPAATKLPKKRGCAVTYDVSGHGKREFVAIDAADIKRRTGAHESRRGHVDSDTHVHASEVVVRRWVGKDWKAWIFRPAETTEDKGQP